MIGFICFGVCFEGMNFEASGWVFFQDNVGDSSDFIQKGLSKLLRFER